ncbi:chaperonin: PROVISIONAL [Gigaspora margarita]|uniref:Chaperonin: PROVISIONAL n=1 Tax=Gigaspora margarita TaxID=4874 RepID=A0A8H3XMD2_GIGMA|nr:chaperonin: PROVISIONAL [Gigaspora margarita]
MDFNGNRKITFYNWTQFLDQFFIPVSSILMQHHFIMSCNYPRKVKIQKLVDSNETEISIAKVSLFSKTKNRELVFPDIIIPQEISLE